jgi:hypothetical protein
MPIRKKLNSIFSKIKVLGTIYPHVENLMAKQQTFSRFWLYFCNQKSR